MRNGNQSTAFGNLCCMLQHGLANAIAYYTTGLNTGSRTFARLSPLEQPLGVLLSNLVEIQTFKNAVGTLEKALINSDLPHLDT